MCTLNTLTWPDLTWPDHKHVLQQLALNVHVKHFDLTWPDHKHVLQQLALNVHVKHFDLTWPDLTTSMCYNSLLWMCTLNEGRKREKRPTDTLVCMFDVRGQTFAGETAISVGTVPPWFLSTGRRITAFIDICKSNNNNTIIIIVIVLLLLLIIITTIIIIITTTVIINKNSNSKQKR